MATRMGLALFFLCLMSGCESETSSCDPSIAAPKLKNLTLAMETWNTVPGSTAGAFTFNSANPDNPFTPFGYTAEGKTFPNLEFKPRLDADVLSPITGVVTAVTAQAEADEGYEIHLREVSTSCYLIGIDHVRNPTVSAGDAVSAGQKLGIPGAWSAYAGQVELQINSDIDNSYLCPVDLIDPTSMAATKSAVTQLMADWESLKGSTALYDQAAMASPGCVVATLVQ